MTTYRDPDLRRFDSEKFFVDPNSNGEKRPFPSLSKDATVELSVVVPSYNEELRCKACTVLYCCYQGYPDTRGKIAWLTHRTPPPHVLAKGHYCYQPGKQSKITIAELSWQF